MDLKFKTHVKIMISTSSEQVYHLDKWWYTVELSLSFHYTISQNPFPYICLEKNTILIHFQHSNGSRFTVASLPHCTICAFSSSSFPPGIFLIHSGPLYLSWLPSVASFPASSLALYSLPSTFSLSHLCCPRFSSLIFCPSWSRGLTFAHFAPLLQPLTTTSLLCCWLKGLEIKQHLTKLSWKQFLKTFNFIILS